MLTWQLGELTHVTVLDTPHTDYDPPQMQQMIELILPLQQSCPLLVLMKPQQSANLHLQLHLEVEQQEKH